MRVIVIMGGRPCWFVESDVSRFPNDGPATAFVTRRIGAIGDVTLC
jgi:hypothetical protein